MFNPFSSWPVTGTWESHASYSDGGTDYPTPYGTPIIAPASGRLITSGFPREFPGRIEFACGWIGSAGRRSILVLDTPLKRVTPIRHNPQEGSGDCVALVFQHQSRFAEEGHYTGGDKDNPIGWTGASANGVDWGGDVHVHWHGLTARGERVRAESFLTSSTAGGDATPIGDEMTPEQWSWLTTAITNISAYLWGGGPDVKRQIGARESIFGLIIQVQARQAAQDAVIAQLAAGKGIDQKAVAAAVEKAVQEGIAGLKLSGTVTLAPPPAAK